jgi:hypothetical protein
MPPKLRRQSSEKQVRKYDAQAGRATKSGAAYAESHELAMWGNEEKCAK